MWIAEGGTPAASYCNRYGDLLVDPQEVRLGVISGNPAMVFNCGKEILDNLELDRFYVSVHEDEAAALKRLVSDQFIGVDDGSKPPLVACGWRAVR